MHMFMLQIKYDIREGIIQQWKKYAVLCVIYIACIVQFIMLCGANRHIDTYTCGDMVMWMFDGVKKFDAGAKNNVDISSVYILPNVFIAYIVGNYVIKDLYGYGKDILIRTGNRIKWWLSKCIWCVLTSCMCYAVLYAVIVMAGICTGSFSFVPTKEVCYSLLHMDKQLIIDNPNLTGLMASMMVMSLVMTITFGIIQIAVGLIVSPTIAYIIVVSFLVVGAFSDNPLVISIYCMALRSGMYSPGGYNMWLGLLIMAVIIMCCIIAGTLYARRMDIISKKQEWQNPE